MSEPFKEAENAFRNRQRQRVSQAAPSADKPELPTGSAPPLRDPNEPVVTHDEIAEFVLREVLDQIVPIMNQATHCALYEVVHPFSGYSNRIKDAFSRVSREMVPQGGKLWCIALSNSTSPESNLLDPEKIIEGLNSGATIVLLRTGTQVVNPNIRELVACSIEVSRFNVLRFAKAVQRFFDLPELPKLCDADERWVRFVQPADFLVSSTAPQHEVINAIRGSVDRRLNLSLPKSYVPFEQLDGLGEAKRWAQSLIDDIRAAAAGELSWDEVDKGALLAGGPGTGKTTIARSMAHAAGIRFVSTTASSWQAAGHLDDVLQAMNRDFDKATEVAPAILFIDEIDAAGNREGSSDRNGEWVTWTVDHLLTLIDGFDRREKIIVLAATNHPARVDPALRRPGRLDRVITVQKPNSAALEKIYRYYLSKHSEFALSQLTDEDLREAARVTIGQTGSHVERHVREAARKARRDRRPICRMDLLNAVFEKPEPGTLMPMTAEEQAMTACHEAGHALLEFLGPGKGNNVRYMTIVPRADGTLGFVVTLSDEFRVSQCKEDLLAELRSSLAGRAAEEVVYGTDKVTSGCVSDLAFATRLATRMIGQLGFGGSLISLGGDTTSLMANCELREKVDKLLLDQYEITVALLKKHQSALNALSKRLFEQQEMDGPEIQALLANFGLPE